MLMTVCQTTGLHTAGKLEVIILYIDTESGPFVELSTLATYIATPCHKNGLRSHA